MFSKNYKKVEILTPVLFIFSVLFSVGFFATPIITYASDCTNQTATGSVVGANATLTIPDGACPMTISFSSYSHQGTIIPFGDQILTDNITNTYGPGIYNLGPVTLACNWQTDLYVGEVQTNLNPDYGNSNLIAYDYVENQNCNIPPANTPPTITLIGDNPLNLNVGTLFTDPGATATDQEDGDLTSHIIETGTVNATVVGSYILTYSVTDSGGLSASTTRTVNVNPPPSNQCVIDVVSDITNQVVGGGNAVATYSENANWTASIPGATWIWKTFFVTNPTQAEFETFTKTFNIISATTVDSASLVVAVDNSYTVSINGAQVGADSTEFNYFNENKHTYNVAQFLHDGSNTISFTVKNWGIGDTQSVTLDSTAQSNPAGLLYKLTITTNDENCNPSPTNTPPTITLLGANPINLTAGHYFADPGATATDQEDGDLTSQIVKTGSVNTEVAGTYTLTYSVTDSGGLSASVTRQVIVSTAACMVKFNICEGGNGQPKIIPPTSFSDVLQDNQYYADVQSASSQCLFIGYTAGPVGLFGVNDDLTHAQTATVLSRMFHWDITNLPSVSTFSDEPIDGVHRPDIEAMYRMGFADVCSTHPLLFCPDQGVTRQQLSMLLVKTLGLNLATAPTTPFYKDEVQSDPSFPYIQLMIQNDIIGACPQNSNTFCQTTVVQRGEAARIFDKANAYFLAHANFCPLPTNHPPTITIIGSNPLNLIVGNTFTDPGATATDQEDGDLTSHIIETGTVNATVIGSYILTYSVTDSGGLSASTTRTVNVNPVVCTENCGGGGNPNADLTVTKTADKAIANVGDTLIYTIHVTNNGPDNATGVIVTDILNSDLNFVSATTSLGSYATTTGIWTIGDLANTASTTLTITTTIKDNSQGQTIPNTAVTAATQEDSSSGNNTSTVNVVVNPVNSPNTPAVSLVANPQTITEGDSSTLSWSSQNTFSCSASWTTATSTSGTQDVSPASTGDYSITCTGTFGSAYATTTITVNPKTTPQPADNGGSSSGGGGGGGSIGGHRHPIVTATTGEILGAISCSYLRDYLKIDWQNDPIEVLKLQSFLNVFEKENLSLTGVFNQETFNAVQRFQIKYNDDILIPWGPKVTTGFVYILTKKKINEIYCNTIYPLSQADQNEINQFKALGYNYADSTADQNTSSSPGSNNLSGSDNTLNISNDNVQNGTPVVNLTSSSSNNSVVKNLAISLFALPQKIFSNSGYFVIFLILLIILAVIILLTRPKNIQDAPITPVVTKTKEKKESPVIILPGTLPDEEIIVENPDEIEEV